MNDILIEVSVPFLSAVYEVWVSPELCGYEMEDLLLQMIRKRTQGKIPFPENMAIYQKSGLRIRKDRYIGAQGVKSGMRLVFM